MPIRYKCQGCQRLLTISARRIGTALPCPACGVSTVVPSHDIDEGPATPVSPADGGNIDFPIPSRDGNEAGQSPKPQVGRQALETGSPAPRAEAVAAKVPAQNVGDVKSRPVGATGAPSFVKQTSIKDVENFVTQSSGVPEGTVAPVPKVPQKESNVVEGPQNRRVTNPTKGDGAKSEKSRGPIARTDTSSATLGEPNDGKSRLGSLGGVDAAKEGDPSQFERDEDSLAPAISFRKPNIPIDELDLTPMVDVVFQLLIFFMITASFTIQKSIRVPVPETDKKGATQTVQTIENLQEVSMIAVINEANLLTLDDEPTPVDDQLADRLREKMRSEKKTEIIVQANRRAQLKIAIEVMDAANAAGVPKIRMATRSTLGS